MNSWKIWILLLLMGGFAVNLQAQDDSNWISRLGDEKGWVPWNVALTRPTTVKKLYIKNKAPLDLEALRTFHNLTGLILVDSEIDDLLWLEEFPNLIVFECQGNQLRSLEGIQHLNQAEEISVNSNFIHDLSPLRGMTQLKALSLYENEITHLDSIAHLTNVLELDLSKNKISSLAPIADWTQLQSLSVFLCTQLKGVDEIASFTKLHSLNISLLELPDFSLHLLDSLSHLEDLRIQGMVHSNDEVKLLARHTGLQDLTMGKNDNVTDLSPLQVLSKLEYLDIHSNNVKNIDVLESLPELVKLVMYKNQVEDISPIAWCDKLKAVFMFDNPIKDTAILYELTYLQYLHVPRTCFDKAAAMRLKKALPKTKVLFF